MNWVGLIVFLVVCALTIWLIVDTIIWLVKRIKAKKEIKNKKDDEVINKE